VSGNPDYKKVRVPGMVEGEDKLEPKYLRFFTPNIYEKKRNAALKTSQTVADDLHRLEMRPVKQLLRQQRPEQTPLSHRDLVKYHLAAAKHHEHHAAVYRDTGAFAKYRDEDKAKLHDKARRLHLEAASTLRDRVQARRDSDNGVSVKSAHDMIESWGPHLYSDNGARLAYSDALQEEGRTHEGLLHHAIARPHDQEVHRQLRESMKSDREGIGYGDDAPRYHSEKAREHTYNATDATENAVPDYPERRPHATRALRYGEQGKHALAEVHHLRAVEDHSNLAQDHREHGDDFLRQYPDDPDGYAHQHHEAADAHEEAAEHHRVAAAYHRAMLSDKPEHWTKALQGPDTNDVKHTRPPADEHTFDRMVHADALDEAGYSEEAALHRAVAEPHGDHLNHAHLSLNNLQKVAKKQSWHAANLSEALGVTRYMGDDDPRLDATRAYNSTKHGKTPTRDPFHHHVQAGGVVRSGDAVTTLDP
jgi:hypothetical protein